MYSHWLYSGVSSPILSTVIVGITSQIWLRRYHPVWFKKYNYILAGALDGGAQVIALSFEIVKFKLNYDRS